MRAEEIKGLMEAYSHVYETPEVLSEEVIEEDLETLDEQGRNKTPQAVIDKNRAALGNTLLYGNAAGKRPEAPITRNRNVRGGGTIKPPAAPAKPAAPAAPAKPAAPAAPAKPAAPAAPAAAKPAPAPAAKPTPSATAKPSTPAAPAKPAPGTKAAGPESIKPKTPNPLMQKTFGYQTGNAPDQIKKASEGKPALPASTTALGSAADPKVRAALNLPSKPAASLSQKPEAPKPEAPKPQMSARAQALKAGGPAGGAREKMLNQGVDIFDLVKGHLLDEGYAETEENAVAMMANMSEEWRKSILEAYGIEILDEASYSAKAARAGKDIGKPGKMFGKIAKEAGERYGSEERGKKVAGAVLAKLRKEENENGSIELEDILALNRRMERVYEAQRARENPEDHD
ncbi:MAG: hypothetical protein ACO24P_04910, partial [Candidatus Nanopelagicaceae bacterium]